MAHFFSFLSKHSWPKRIPFPLAMNVSNVSFFENPLVFLTQIRERGKGGGSDPKNSVEMGRWGGAESFYHHGSKAGRVRTLGTWEH